MSENPAQVVHIPRAVLAAANDMANEAASDTTADDPADEVEAAIRDAAAASNDTENRS